MSTYSAPDQLSVGHVHLKVKELPRAFYFYVDLLGLQVMQQIKDHVAFLSAGGYHHHVALNTWGHSLQGPPASRTTGLYHVAFKYPNRMEFAKVVKRLVEAGYPLTGAADHGVSEAIYVNDPDMNGVELYWDKPKNEWPIDANGKLQMYTEYLDVDALVASSV